MAGRAGHPAELPSVISRDVRTPGTPGASLDEAVEAAPTLEGDIAPDNRYFGTTPVLARISPKYPTVVAA